MRSRISFFRGIQNFSEIQEKKEWTRIPREVQIALLSRLRSLITIIKNKQTFYFILV